MAPRAFLLVRMRGNGHWSREDWDRALRGDPGVWDRIWERYQLPLYVWTRELLSNDQDALDVVQETFARAVEHLHRLRDPERLGAWLFSIARQRRADLLRRNGRNGLVSWEQTEDPDGEAAALPAQTPSPDEWLICQEDQERFFRALAALPEGRRAVVLLHFLEGFRLEEIAQILGLHLGTVKSRLYYARRHLQAALATDLHPPTSTS